MKCSNKKCNNEADESYGSGKYCSRKCSNTRVRSEETKEKIRQGVKRKGAKRPPLTEQQLEQWRASAKKSWKEKYDAKPFDELSIWKKRDRVLEEQSFCCNECGVSEWRGVKLSLELDHKDGDTTNNHRDNLHALCPNCHSITDTWRGRNKGAHGKRVEDAVLADALKSEPSIRAALLKVGLAGKGGNYKRAKVLVTP